MNGKRGGILVHHDIAQQLNPFQTKLTPRHALHPYPFIPPLPLGLNLKQSHDIRPYHTLIPLIETSKMQDFEFSFICAFPTKMIFELIKAMDPRISLEEIALMMEQPIEQVCNNLMDDMNCYNVYIR